MTFSKEEDNRIIGLVKEHERDFKKIARLMENCRSAKQIRERYDNHLADDIKGEKLNEDEEKVFWELYCKYSTEKQKWKLISSQMSGRTTLQVKNHYNNFQRKYYRRIKKRKDFALILN
ncbi:9239_t:CDS:2 [Paraglomus occultum]|uniref:9239_t:CDS:1 n=1 Tax=Paraglomus occultum TaxID=144539 RepID=A0A9N8VLA1_9GLOM|nr:9239_t:CDS:2 [Paraglomus occultum]